MGDATPGRPFLPWRGSVNQITYGIDLRTPVDDEVIDHLATELIRQRYYASPVAELYDAAVSALASGDRVAFTDDQDETAAHDLLTRLVAELDGRRPWPVAEQGLDMSRITFESGI